MVIGIDLGTSNTVMATVSRDGTPVIIPDANNRDAQSTPTQLLIDGNRAFAGNFADQLFEAYPDKQLLSFFKRYFGTGIPVYADTNGNHWFSEALAALVLKKLQNDVDFFMPDGYQQCVITVPAHYSDIQRKSVFEAARLANMPLTAIIDEPVAAALYYGSEIKPNHEELTLVYDFGGGTFDLTLITQSQNSLNVIAKDGIEKLGGKEFDDIIATEIKQAYQQLFYKDFPNDNLSLNRLQKIAEQLKINGQSQENGLVSKWLLIGKQAFECTINTRAYNQKALQLIDRTGAVVQRCLRSMGLELKDISKIILIGGTSNSKQVYNYWQQKTQGTATQVVYHQPLNSVAKGAALYAQSLLDSNMANVIYKPIALKSVSTYNIGLQFPGQNSIEILIHRNTPLPTAANKLFKVTVQQAPYFAVDICQYWDADEVQVLGTVQLLPTEAIVNDFVLELIIENKANGTIGLKLKNADTGKELKFNFQKKQSGTQYNFQQQKNMIDNIFLNNIV